MKTIEFLKELTGYDFQNDIKSILRSIREMFDIRRQYDDEEVYNYLSTLKFIKRVVDKHDANDFFFNTKEHYYAKKDGNQILIEVTHFKTGSISASFKCTSILNTRVEGQLKHIAKHLGLDLVKEYNAQLTEESNVSEEAVQEPVLETTTIKELSKELGISDRELGWELRGILLNKEISNNEVTIKFDIVTPKGSKSVITIKETIKK